MTDIPVVTNSQGVDSFYRREYRAVFGLAIVLTEIRSAAEELTQDALLMAFKARRFFSDPFDF